MPYSTKYFKEETKNYILNNFNTNIKILDIGAGSGTYSDLLSPCGFKNLDCVEVFTENITKYNLEKKYNKVINEDITKIDIDYSQYDLIILGDVLEHINIDDAKLLLSKIGIINTIICVPFESEQGTYNNNVYENHLQNDLTFINFFDRYPHYFPLCLRFDYGVYVNNNMKHLYIETNEKSIPDSYYQYINNNFNNIKYLNVNTNMINVNSVATIVTGIWDLNRASLSEGWNRSFEHYLSHLERLMKCDNNMIIYIESKYKSFVEQHRKSENTLIIIRELDWFKNNGDMYKKIQSIRTNPDWYNQVGWLAESTQAKLEMYNPVVMSKMFLLNDAAILDPFNSSHLIWVDGALTNTVHEGYFWKDNIINKIGDIFTDFSFVCFPYDGKLEIHGFKYPEMCKYAGSDVDKVARGGIFGGPKERISEINNIYYGLLNDTLNEDLMGTEESIFTIMAYKYPELIQYFEINNDGLLQTFFESVKNGIAIPKREKQYTPEKKEIKNIDKIALYVITFNSPKQFEALIDSMLAYDKDFIENPTKKFLLDNSVDLSTTPEYLKLCEKYGFEHIKKDNIGITGGRQFIAEHFDSTDLDAYLFFEDDMLFSNDKIGICKNGFKRYTTNLYKKVIEIVKNEQFDFLKFNFTEFFGNNSTQWSWYNVPADFRKTHWPKNPKLPEIGLDPNAPKTVFKNIKSYNGISYATGEIYLCNWPQLMSREGNYKCYIETKFASPFEQTIMSFVYQETIKGNINPGLLLLTPTEHNRFDFYDGNLRKEC